MIRSDGKTFKVNRAQAGIPRDHGRYFQASDALVKCIDYEKKQWYHLATYKVSFKLALGLPILGILATMWFS